MQSSGFYNTIRVAIQLGHERIGFLPHTRQWNQIVGELSKYSAGEASVTAIAAQTLDAVRSTYKKMPFDESVIKAICFLTTLAFSSKQENQVAFLNDHGYSVDSQLSLFSLMISAKQYIVTETGSLETNKIACDAAMQAVIRYQKDHETGQLSLFSDTEQSVWSNNDSGAAFCEMARSFFADFTERQIRYYIERTAASSIDDYEALDSFNRQLKAQSKAIANHTFEISKLTESFAAGWYNKNAKNSLPTTNQVEGFLGHAFGKLREEFRREADVQ